jgi:uncharacterized protein YbjT (DUF2867 family)
VGHELVDRNQSCLNPMIALTTPTGNIGSKVLRLLAETTDRPIRVLARNPDRIAEEHRRRVDIVTGSMEDPAALQRLLRDATALLWCQPDAAAADDYLGAYAALAQAGSNAIRAAGVPRVVAVSAAGEPGDTPAGPITALHRMEATLAQSGAAMRWLRCGSFFENLLWQWDTITGEGFFTYPAPGDVPGPQVATADIARVAVDRLIASDWRGQEPIPLLGPRDLSYDEMAGILSADLDQPVRYQPASAQVYQESLLAAGQSRSAARGLVEMFAFLATSYAPPTSADRSLTPTPLEQWLQR